MLSNCYTSVCTLSKPPNCLAHKYIQFSSFFFFVVIHLNQTDSVYKLELHLMLGISSIKIEISRSIRVSLPAEYKCPDSIVQFIFDSATVHSPHQARQTCGIDKLIIKL